MTQSRMQIAVIFGCALFLAGCGFVPGQGPLSSAIDVASRENADVSSPFHMVEMSDEVVAKLIDKAAPSLERSFGTSSPPPQKVISVGDTVTVSIFESAPGGLFSSDTTSAASGARQITLPKQSIGQDGMITIPFAGQIYAVGKKPTTVARLIEDKLDGRAIEPQAIVSFEASTTHAATVMGEVSRSGQVPLAVNGARLLDVLADAAIKLPEKDAQIRVVRGKRSQTVPLTAIINSPKENIFVFPNDTIIVLNDPQVFNVLGAVQKPGQYKIAAQSQTFAGAMAIAGGLSDSKADRGGVFVFRFEKPETARKLLGPDVELKEMPAGIPVVYRIRFSDPSSFFWMQQLEIRKDDMIYVANALAGELNKFLAVFGSIATIESRLN